MFRLFQTFCSGPELRALLLGDLRDFLLPLYIIILEAAAFRAQLSFSIWLYLVILGSSLVCHDVHFHRLADWLEYFYVQRL